MRCSHLTPRTVADNTLSCGVVARREQQTNRLGNQELWFPFRHFRKASNHSQRSATIGSTLAARRAGMKQASNAAKRRMTLTDASRNGSYGDKAKSWLMSKRLVPRQTARPKPSPARV